MVDEKGVVGVTKARLKQLEEHSEILLSLYDNNVSSWSGYADAMEPILKRKKLEKLITTYTESICEVISVDAEVEYPAGRECGHSILISSSLENEVREMLETFLKRVKEDDL